MEPRPSLLPLAGAERLMVAVVVFVAAQSAGAGPGAHLGSGLTETRNPKTPRP